MGYFRGSIRAGERTAQASGHRDIPEIRPDLDSEKELKVIEDIEIQDNEGLTVPAGRAGSSHGAAGSTMDAGHQRHGTAGADSP